MNDDLLSRTIANTPPNEARIRGIATDENKDKKERK